MWAHPLGAVGAIGLFGSTAYAAYFLTQKPRNSRLQIIPTERERRDTFDKLAKSYDSMVKMDEWWNGIQSWRRRLVREAHGHVLEVAAGSARNFPYYDKTKVQSLTLTDFSRQMLSVASGKKDEVHPIPCSFRLQNSLQLDYPDEAFDTVVQTFGLCSYEKPVETLRELCRVLKPDGRLLLLEHGNSTYGLVRRHLHLNRGSHVHKFGCFYDREILETLKRAGIDIEHVEKRHFGTTYLIVARKPLDFDKMLEEASTHQDTSEALKPRSLHTQQ